MPSANLLSTKVPEKDDVETDNFLPYSGSLGYGTRAHWGMFMMKMLGTHVTTADRSKGAAAGAATGAAGIDGGDDDIRDGDGVNSADPADPTLVARSATEVPGGKKATTTSTDPNQKPKLPFSMTAFHTTGLSAFFMRLAADTTTCIMMLVTLLVMLPVMLLVLMLVLVLMMVLMAVLMTLLRLMLMLMVMLMTLLVLMMLLMLMLTLMVVLMMLRFLAIYASCCV
jgi:hypothetical protein